MAGGYQPPPPGYGAPPPQWGPPPGGFVPPPGGYAPPPYMQPGYPPHPGAPYGIDPNTGLPFSDKQKIVAFVLQFFLGAFGAGRFYTGIAVAQIVVSWLTCGIGTLWPTIDGILMLVGRVPDAQGRPLKD